MKIGREEGGYQWFSMVRPLHEIFNAPRALRHSFVRGLQREAGVEIDREGKVDSNASNAKATMQPTLRIARRIHYFFSVSLLLPPLEFFSLFLSPDDGLSDQRCTLKKRMGCFDSRGKYRKILFYGRCCSEFIKVSEFQRRVTFVNMKKS